MGAFGVDVSNWQASFDFRGWDFAFIKATQGNWFKDGRFNQHLTNARAAGVQVAAYHYQETSSVDSQVENIKSMVPTNVPIIIDVERGSGGVDITRTLIQRLRAEGYDVPFLYLPRWYWNEIGQPDLSGLPLLWASWYPDYVARPREQARDMVPGSAWNAYGGVNVAIMQFTSSPFDQNWYPGSRDDLARLLNGGAGGGGIDDMSWSEVIEVTKGEEVWADPAGTVVGSMLGHVLQVKDEVAELRAAVDEIQVGGIDYERLATLVAVKMLEQLDVDLVRRPGS